MLRINPRLHSSWEVITRDQASHIAVIPHHQRLSHVPILHYMLQHVLVQVIVSS